MYDLSRHPYFDAWTDPSSGITSYLLRERVAPMQKTFYFVNSGLTHDGRWLWFEAAHPPGNNKCLAAVCLDPDHPELRVFPQATISAESPLPYPDQNKIWYVSDDHSPDIRSLDLDSGAVEHFAHVPQEYIARRYVRRISTHLTLSADGRDLLLDGKIGNLWFLARVDVHTRAFALIREFPIHYNHAQFSTRDPDLLSVAQDWWIDPDTGVHNQFTHRIWWMRRDGTEWEPLHPVQREGHLISHEWWADDGTQCWINYQTGAFEMDGATRAITHVWKRPVCHAHCDATRQHWVADQSPYAWHERPCELLFFDRPSGREITIASALPKPTMDRRGYHIDPHPRFIDQGRAVCYTSTVRGMPDVAIVRTADILAAMSKG